MRGSSSGDHGVFADRIEATDLLVGAQASRPRQAVTSALDDRQQVRMRVARGFSEGPLPMGLDREFLLRGGDRLEVDELAHGLPFPWQEGLCAAVAEACSRSAGEGPSFLAIPPLLLIGDKGVGRTHATRRIAALADVPHASFDLSDVDPSRLGGRSAGPDLVLPCPPVMALVASGCANPVISVTGVQHADPAAQEWLIGILDRARARRWIDHAVAAMVDLSMISWMIQADDVGELPPALLNATHVVRMNLPVLDETSLHHANVLIEVVADLGLHDALEPWTVSEALDAMARVPGAQAAPSSHAQRGEPQAGYTARLYATAARAVARSVGPRG